MSIYLGNTEIGQLFLGNVKVAEAYLGSTKIYEAPNEDEWELISDSTLGGEVITPIGYNSSTGEYEVSSFPTWVTAAVDSEFQVVVVANDFSDIANIPIPYGNNSNSITIKKTDNTHFVITKGTGTSNVSNWQLARNFNASKIQFIEASKYENLRGVPLKLVVDNTSGYISSYGTIYIINGASGYSQGGNIKTTGCSSLGYSTGVKLLGTLEAEFTLSTSANSAIITSINKQTCISVSKGKFVTLESTNLVGDSTASLWGKGANTGVYIGGLGISRPDCRARLYKKK